MHAYRGGAGFGRSELPGLPVQTSLLPTHRGAPAYHAGLLRTATPPLSRSVAVGDVNGDGKPELVVSDASGYVFAFDRRGRVLPGSRCARTRTSRRRCRRTPTTARTAASSPARRSRTSTASPGLEIVDGGLDRHLYAWTGDGRPLSGFPVQLVDPTKVQSIDPTTHAVTFKPDAAQLQGTKIIDTASDRGHRRRRARRHRRRHERGVPRAAERHRRDLHRARQHRGRLQLAAVRRPLDRRLAAGLALPAGLPGQDRPARLRDPAGRRRRDRRPAALADLDGDGKPEIGVLGTTGPGYLLRGDGSSFLGNGGDGRPQVLDANLGVGLRLARHAEHPVARRQRLRAPDRRQAELRRAPPAASAASSTSSCRRTRPCPTTSCRRSTRATGLQLPAFPRRVADLSFLNSPAVADVDGDGHQEALQGTAVYDLHAISATGAEAAGFPRLTGGWMVTTPAIGDVDGDGRLELVAITREGYLLAWNLPARHPPRATGPRSGTTRATRPT